MKVAKIMNAISGVALIAYAFLAAIFSVKYVSLLGKTMGELSVHANEFSPDLLLENYEGDVLLLGMLMYFALFCGIVLLSFFIVTLVMNCKVQPKQKGRTFGIIASSIGIGGFLIGWVPYVNVLFVLATAVLFFISFYYFEKHPIYVDNDVQQNEANFNGGYYE